MSAVSLDQLNAADAAGFLAALGSVYEHSPWVAEAALSRRPFARLKELHEAMRAGRIDIAAKPACREYRQGDRRIDRRRAAAVIKQRAAFRADEAEESGQ